MKKIKEKTTNEKLEESLTKEGLDYLKKHGKLPVVLGSLKSGDS